MKSSLPKSTHFYLIRHGETEWNAAGRIQGHADSPPTKKGIARAYETASKLKKKPITHVYSSDLGRAQHTAQIIAKNRKQPVTSLVELREVSFGPFDGANVEVFRAELKQQLTQRDSLPFVGQMTYQLHPAIESFQQTAQRVTTVLYHLHQRHPGEHVAVVTHGAVLRILLMSIHRVGVEVFPPNSFENAGYVHLTMHEDTLAVVKTVGVTTTIKSPSM